VTMNAACGISRVPLSRFTPASAIAAVAWAAYTAGLGFIGGAAFIANPLLGLAVGLGLSFAVGGAIELIRKRKARRSARPTSPSSSPSPSPSRSSSAHPSSASAVCSPAHISSTGSSPASTALVRV
jgi:membrane-associated protein